MHLLVLFVAFETILRVDLPFLPVISAPLLPGWPPLLLPFVVGMTFYVWRDNIPVGIFWVFCAIGICAVTKGMPYYKFIILLRALYIAVFVAYGLKGWILRYNAVGDYSYGTYFIGLPVQQAVVAVLGPMTPMASMGVAVPVTLVLAVICYHYVERPCLKLKHQSIV